MSCGMWIVYGVMIFGAINILYMGSIGLGLLTSHWLRYNIETGCSLDADSMLYINTTKCEIGAYKCVVSDNYHLFAICPIYGTPVYILLVLVSLVFCVRQRCCVEEPNYNIPYGHVVEARYAGRY